MNDTSRGKTFVADPRIAGSSRGSRRRGPRIPRNSSYRGAPRYPPERAGVEERGVGAPGIFSPLFPVPGVPGALPPRRSRGSTARGGSIAGALLNLKVTPCGRRYTRACTLPDHAARPGACSSAAARITTRGLHPPAIPRLFPLHPAMVLRLLPVHFRPSSSPPPSTLRPRAPRSRQQLVGDYVIVLRQRQHPVSVVFFFVVVVVSPPVT